MKKNFVETYRVSKTFKAPLDFVFAWCTDFREDDGEMTGSKARRTFLERTKQRVVWVSDYKKKGKDIQGVRAVWLNPPDSWHLDTCGDQRELGDYVLRPKGKKKTKLDMKFKVAYESKDEVVDTDKWEKEVSDEWNIFAERLEKDYKESLSAVKK